MLRLVQLLSLSADSQTQWDLSPSAVHTLLGRLEDPDLIMSIELVVAVARERSHRQTGYADQSVTLRQVIMLGEGGL